MDERCFRPLLCTVKAELGRGQPGLMRWIWDETLPQSSIDRATFYSAAHRATKWASGRPHRGKGNGAGIMCRINCPILFYNIGNDMLANTRITPSTLIEGKFCLSVCLKPLTWPTLALHKIYYVFLESRWSQNGKSAFLFWGQMLCQYDYYICVTMRTTHTAWEKMQRRLVEKA